MKIYFDTCCLNRPFDLAANDRIALESEAILRILERIEARQWELVVSSAVLFELRQNPDSRRRDGALKIVSLASHHQQGTDEITSETIRLTGLGFGYYDAAHLAFASAARVGVFLTVDDRLLRKARSLSTISSMVVDNPVPWLATTPAGASP